MSEYLIRNPFNCIAKKYIICLIRPKSWKGEKKARGWLLNDNCMFIEMLLKLRCDV